MGYAVYKDQHARDHGVDRWAGYGVPATCDMPECSAEINRGLAYKCEAHYTYDDDGEETQTEGCDLFFCLDHEIATHNGATPKPDTPEWVNHILTDDSWAKWRKENPDYAARARKDTP